MNNFPGEDEVLVPKPMTWKTLLVIAVGFGSDAYDFFVLNVLQVIFKEIYPDMSQTDSQLLVNSALVGSIIGQLIFGNLGDSMGRKKMFLVTLSLLVVFAILSASAQSFGSTHILFIWLSISRFFLGIGVGGEYPLSATVTAERSTQETRGRNMAIVFSAQGVGNLTASVTLLILVFSNLSLEWVWRLALLFPALICILSAYPRWILSESTRFLNAGLKKEEKTKFCQKVSKVLSLIWRHKLNLLGTAGSWFLFDVTFYGNSLFNASVLKVLSFSSTLHYNVLFSVIIAAIGLPGYFFSIFFAERIGRKVIQMMGFLMIGIIFLVMGLAFDFLTKKIPALFVILYGLTFFFSNFGPNATTYTIPAEVYPVEIAAFCHGISAAAGKLGAVLGTSAFKPMQNAYGLEVVFFTCAGIAFLGFLLTVVVTKDTRDINLYEIDQTKYQKEARG